MKYLTLFCTLLMFLSSCGKQNLHNAKDSLEGHWTVTDIFSASGERMTNGISIIHEETETGTLGSFVFTKDQVDYTFTRQGIEKNGIDQWTLVRTKDNAGFTKSEVYTLSFGDLVLECDFGDQTSDAEKDATEIRLTYETVEIGDFETFTLFMKRA